jgi:hypothetical protein
LETELKKEQDEAEALGKIVSKIKEDKNRVWDDFTKEEAYEYGKREHETRRQRLV